MLKNVEKNTGAMGIGKSALVTDEDTPLTLLDMGISYDLSSRAQQIASIPEEEFEQTIAEHREEQHAVSSRTMEKLAKKSHNHRAQGTGENECYTRMALT